MKRNMRNAALLFVLVLCVLVMGSGCGNNPHPPDYVSGAVTGTVTDASNGAPLAGVDVSIGAFNTTTNSAGVYKLKKVYVGEHTLTAQKDGYANYSATITVAADKTTTHNFSMNPPAPGTGTVSGTVTYSMTGDPVNGALVSIGDLQDTTDAEGNYTITDVTPGADLAITGACPGYQDYAGTVDVAADETTDHDFQMLPVDGRVVMFVSYATNLDENYHPDNLPEFIEQQVYCRDLITQKTTIISKNPEDTGEGEEQRFGGNGLSEYPDISADGRYVVFASYATNLVPDFVDERSFMDIFLYDRQEGMMKIITVNADGEAANGDSSYPRISADGRYVVFQTWADDLPGTQCEGWNIIVRYDIENETFLQITPDVEGKTGLSVNPVISADGRYVAFSSNSPNLVPGIEPDIEDPLQIFRCDCEAAEDKYILVTKGVPDKGQRAVDEIVPSNNSNEFPSISADGNYITYFSCATDLTDDELDPEGGRQSFLYDTSLDKNILISRSQDPEGFDGANGQCDRPTISADGRYIALFSTATDLIESGTTVGYANVFLYDREEKTMTLISHVPGGAGEADSDSVFALIAPDGSYVIYNSDATDLDENGNETGFWQVYIYARETGTNAKISTDPEGEPGNDDSFSPIWLQPEG